MAATHSSLTWTWLGTYDGDIDYAKKVMGVIMQLRRLDGQVCVDV